MSYSLPSDGLPPYAIQLAKARIVSSALGPLDTSAADISAAGASTTSPVCSQSTIWARLKWLTAMWSASLLSCTVGVDRQRVQLVSVLVLADVAAVRNVAVQGVTGQAQTYDSACGTESQSPNCRCTPFVALSR